MCLLTYFPEGIHPDVAALNRGARVNADGHGFAIVVPKSPTERARIIVRKSMDPMALIKEFALMRMRYPHGPALFHSRITTDGETNLFNCHPFMHSGDKRTVIGHNGVLPSSVRPEKGDSRSDTRIFAENVAGEFRLHTTIGRELAGEWMGSYNKIVILTVDPLYDRYGYIVNESSGTWDNGIWYSNTSFRGYRTTVVGNGGWEYYSRGEGGTGGWGEWTWCTNRKCTAKLATVNPGSLVCTLCKECSLCEGNPCECELTSGKGESPRKGSSAGGVTARHTESSDQWAEWDAYLAEKDAALTTEAEYRAALDEAARASASDDDPADAASDGVSVQLQEVLALVEHLNRGGDIDDWAPDSSARGELDRWLAVKAAERGIDLKAITSRPLLADLEDEIQADAAAVALEAGADLLAEIVSDLEKSGDPADDQESLIMGTHDYLVHNGVKYAVE